MKGSVFELAQKPGLQRDAAAAISVTEKKRETHCGMRLVQHLQVHLKMLRCLKHAAYTNTTT